MLNVENIAGDRTPSSAVPPPMPTTVPVCDEEPTAVVAGVGGVRFDLSALVGSGAVRSGSCLGRVGRGRWPRRCRPACTEPPAAAAQDQCRPCAVARPPTPPSPSTRRTIQYGRVLVTPGERRPVVAPDALVPGSVSGAGRGRRGAGRSQLGLHVAQGRTECAQLTRP